MQELIVDKASEDSALTQIQDFFDIRSSVSAVTEVKIILPKGIQISGGDISEIIELFKGCALTVEIGDTSTSNPDAAALINLMVETDPQYDLPADMVEPSIAAGTPSLEVDLKSDTRVLDQIKNFLSDPDIKVGSKVAIGLPIGSDKVIGGDVLDIQGLLDDYKVTFVTPEGHFDDLNLENSLQFTEPDSEAGSMEREEIKAVGASIASAEPASLDVDAASETSVLEQVTNFLANIQADSRVEIYFPKGTIEEADGGDIQSIVSLLSEYDVKISTPAGSIEGSALNDLIALIHEPDSHGVSRQASGADDDDSSSAVGGASSSDEDEGVVARTKSEKRKLVTEKDDDMGTESPSEDEHARSGVDDDNGDALKDASARKEAKEKLVFRLDLLNTGMLLNEQFGHHLDRVTGNKHAQDVVEVFLAGATSVMGHIGGMDNYYCMPLARASMFFANKYGRASIEDSFKYYLSDSIGEKGAVLVGDMTVGAAFAALSVHPVFTFGVMAMGSVSKYAEVEQSAQVMTTGAVIAGGIAHSSGVGSIYEVASAAITGMHAGNALNGLSGNSIEDGVDSLIDAVGKITPTQLFQGYFD